MTEKTKKRLTIAGVSVLGLALLVAIGMQFAKAPDKKPNPTTRFSNCFPGLK